MMFTFHMLKKTGEKKGSTAAEATVMSNPRGMPVCMGWHGKAHIEQELSNNGLRVAFFPPLSE